MLSSTHLQLFAIHISDGYLSVPWIVGGFVATGLIVSIALLVERWKTARSGEPISEQEIAWTGVMTAAFFVATMIRVPIAPTTTVHLLFNGLLGVILRWRAALAILVGLLIQAALLGHGGFLSLGVNYCVMVLPAMMAWGSFEGLRRLPFVRRPWFRGALVVLSVGAWVLCIGYGIVLALQMTFQITPNAFVHFGIGAGALLVSLVASVLEPKLQNAPEFPLGLFLGTTTVLLTMVCHCAALILGRSSEGLQIAAAASFVAHLPVAAIEGVVVGSTLGFLTKVKPELLGWKRPNLEENEAAREVPELGLGINDSFPAVEDPSREDYNPTGNTSSSVTSH
ncbi:MAG: CbiM family transporter [Gemmataceae bacterium]